MVIRKEVLNDTSFSCDLLREDLTYIKTLHTFEVRTLEVAFAKIVNTDSVPKSGWFIVDNENFDESFKNLNNLKLGEYYYANEL